MIPHYYMRTKDGAPWESLFLAFASKPRFDIDNPHSGLGRMKEYDREEWLLKYKDGLYMSWRWRYVRGGGAKGPERS